MASLRLNPALDPDRLAAAYRPTRRLVIDLSEAAARELGMFRRGIARVTLKVLKADQP